MVLSKLYKQYKIVSSVQVPAVFLDGIIISVMSINNKTHYLAVNDKMKSHLFWDF